MFGTPLTALVVISTFGKATGDVIDGIRYYRLLGDSKVSLAVTSLLADLVVQSKKGCSAKCNLVDDCFGFEYNAHDKRCRLIRGSGKANATSFPSQPYPGVDVYWMYPIYIPFCPELPNYGPSATTNFATASKAFNTTITLGCNKWSAFNTAQLVAMNYTSPGPTTGLDLEDMFTQKITLTCTKDGSWKPRPAQVPECQDFLECLRTPRGKEFRGTTYRTTETGKTCVPWNTVPGMIDWMYSPSNGMVWAGGSLGSQSNYCRNPGRDKVRPWCYVSTTQWEYCNISMCKDPRMASLECKFTDDGYEYLGKMNKTTSGLTCVSWNFASAAKYAPHFPDDDAAVTHNYCRNPGRDTSYPWCYYAPMTGVYDLCLTNKVPFCPGFP